MSFKFFRKYQKVMLWVIVVITVFTFSIFSVTSTMQTCFRREVAGFGVFTDSRGKEVEITERMYYHWVNFLQRFAPFIGLQSIPEEQVFAFIILDHEAKLAGIRISDQELGKAIGNLGAKNREDYVKALRNFGFVQPSKFEEGFRELSVVQRYKYLTSLTGELLLSEDLYQDWKLENEEFKLAYTAFPYTDYAEEVNESTVEAEELESYYNGLPASSSEVREYFSEPEKFDFDVAYLDLSQVNYEAYADLVAKVEEEPNDGQLFRFYEQTKERYKLEDPEADEGGSGEDEPEEDDGGGAGDEPEEDDGDPAAGDEADQDEGIAPEDEPEGDEGNAEGEEEEQDHYRSFNEVKEEVRKEYMLAKVVEKACFEWVDYARKQEIIGKTAEEPKPPEEEDAPSGGGTEPDTTGEKKGDPSDGTGKKEKEGGQEGAGGGEADVPGGGISQEGEPAAGENGAGDASGPEGGEGEETPDAHFEALLARYQLSRDRVEGPVSLDDLPGLERYGSEVLKSRMRALKVNNAAYFQPDEGHPALAYFVRVTRLVERRKKELDEVRDVAMERFVLKERRELAEEDAKAFIESIENKARELEEVRTVVDEWKAEAEAEAEAEIKSRTGLTEEDAVKQLESLKKRKISMLETDISSLVDRYEYRFFDEEAEARDLTVHAIDYFKKSETRSPEYFEREDSPEKFLMSYRRIFDLDTDGVTDPIDDREGESWYVVRVLDRRFPPASEMKETDYDLMKRNVERQRMLEQRYPQYYQSTREDPFAFEKLARDYNLRFYKRADAGEETTPEETGDGEPSMAPEPEKPDEQVPDTPEK